VPGERFKADEVDLPLVLGPERRRQAEGHPTRKCDEKDGEKYEVRANVARR
jgi:hypothetical protein